MKRSEKGTEKVGKPTGEEIKAVVRQRYAWVAQSSSCAPGSCCGGSQAVTPRGRQIAKALGYSPDIELMPESATESFAGCGNPVAVASLNKGETVLDLGAGAGLDALLAAQKVGETGKVIGLDMTPEMLQKARENVAKLGVKNVEFRAGDIENMPVADDSIDVAISNCVINLAPDKSRVFQEAYRVLKPGGRMIISDIVSEGELPPQVRDSLAAWAGCVAGALPEQEYLHSMKRAGFVEVRVVAKVRLGVISSDTIEAHKPL